MNEELTPQERTALRVLAGLQPRDTRPVEVWHEAARNGPPIVVGQGWHYETRTGLRIWRPSAYKKRGWSSMRYVASTRRVLVGADWLAAWRAGR